jgi:SAM-dependent methyltransferase
VSYFRRQAAAYAEFRPGYPDELFRFAASLVKRHELAWDCATGNGQAATRLAEYFDHVIATDISQEQLAHARQHAKVEYRVAPAEASGLPDRSVDLITVCQAMHWLDRPRFFAEVKRVLVPGGGLVVTMYGDAHVADNAELDVMLQKFNKETLRDYWPVGRNFVSELYKAIEFPFPRLPVPDLKLRKLWTLPQLAGYMRSWSATDRYIERHGSDPVTEIERQMQALWGDPATTREISWPFRIFAGRFENA